MPAASVSPLDLVRLDGLRRALVLGFGILLPLHKVVGTGGKLINVSMADALLPLGLLFLGWRSLTAGLRLPKLALCLAAMFVLTVSAWFNLDRTFSERGSLNVIVELVKVGLLWLYFYLVINLIDDRDDLVLFLRAWVFSGTIVGLLGVGGSLYFQLTGVHNPFSLFFRAQGTFEDSNLFSAHMALGFFFAWTCRRITGSRSLWLPAAMAAQVAGIIFSASRGGLLSLGLSLALIWLFWTSMRAKVIAAFAAILLGTIFLIVPNKAALLDWNPVTSRLVTTTVDLDNPEAQQRRELWQVAINSFVSSPILGIGKGNYGLGGQTGGIGYAHNTYLGMLAELGLAGFLVFVSLLVTQALGLLAQVLSRNSRSAMLLLAGAVSIMLAGVTINLENYRGLWVTLGAGEAYRRIAAGWEKEE
jgi:O-antigen ligase